MPEIIQIQPLNISTETKDKRDEYDYNYDYFPRQKCYGTNSHRID